jgi:transposase-like protein
MEKRQKGPRPHHDEAFKRSAVELLVVSGKSIKQVAGELGVAHWTLREWKKRYGAGPTPRTLSELENENRRLRQELLRAQTQRDILKKTLGILSNPNDSALHG